MRKAVFVSAILATYIFVPGYRYYVLGSYIAYKIMSDKGPKVRTIPKESRLYKQVMGHA